MAGITPHGKTADAPYSRLRRRTASVSWLVNACRAQWTCERRILPRVSLIFLRRNWRPASRSTRGCADYASTMWLTPHVRLTSPPGGGTDPVVVDSLETPRAVRPRTSPPPATVPPLPREPLCQTRTPLSRGRGGGGGTTSCRQVVGTRTPSITRSRTAGGGLNLEYGASAVFPCGQSQRSIRTTTLPH